LPTILYNPLLMTTDLSAPWLLQDQAFLWSPKADATTFLALNETVETLHDSLGLGGRKPQLRGRAASAQTHQEPHDALSGFQALLPLLGITEDSGHLLAEELSWLDEPANIPLLFDYEAQQEHLRELRQHKGWR